MVHRALAVSIALGVLWFAPRRAEAEDFVFFDPHPIHPAAGGGFCEAAGAHVHDYAPVDPGAFLLRDGLWFFVGDPVRFGYRGIVYSFDGPHEVPGAEGSVACTIPGRHHHLYPPGPGPAAAPETAWIGGPGVPAFFWDPRPPHRPDRARGHRFPTAPPPAVAPRPGPRPPVVMTPPPRGSRFPRRAAEPAAAPPPPAHRAPRRP